MPAEFPPIRSRTNRDIAAADYGLPAVVSAVCSESYRKFARGGGDWEDGKYGCCWGGEEARWRSLCLLVRLGQVGKVVRGKEREGQGEWTRRGRKSRRTRHSSS